ncbi:MAG TPA: ABC transporter ATP-binding protein [Polyangiales bacterium]|nr:ABC transporter ATP-binding protein [Polyangiales bacterium]
MCGAELILDGLDARLGGRTILDGIDLHVAPGEFVSVVGRSGSGKSTLLRVLAGLLPPSRGELQVDAPPIIMFQEPRLLPWRSVLQNICLGLPHVDRAAAMHVLDEVGLADRAGDYPGILSGGQRQRVALARALMHRPRLMLLDEPFCALDALTRIAAQRLVENLWREHGFTAVLVTHDVDEAVLLGDHVLVINEGRVVFRQHVDLPRPRPRNSPEVGRLVSAVLEAIFDERPAQQGARATQLEASSGKPGFWPAATLGETP